MQLRLLKVPLIAQLILGLYLLVIAASILDDIWGFLSGAANTVADAIGSVWNAIQAFFHAVGSVFSAVSDAWGWAFNGIVWLATTAAQAVWDGVQGLQWVIFQAIPDAVSFAVSWAFTAIKTAVDAAVDALTSAIQAAVQFLEGVINAVEAALTTFIKFVEGLANAALYWIEWAGKWVWGIVHDPEKLLAWIWSTIVVWILKEFWALGRTIAHFLWDLIRRDARGFIHAIEDVVSAVL